MAERESSERVNEMLANVLGVVGELVAAVQGWVDRHADEINAAIRWVVEHQQELEGFATWGAVRRARVSKPACTHRQRQSGRRSPKLHVGATTLRFWAR